MNPIKSQLSPKGSYATNHLEKDISPRPTTEERISQIIQKYLAEVTSNEIQLRVDRHLRRMGLKDHTGLKIREEMAAGLMSLDQSDLRLEAQAMIHHITKNPYMMRVLKAAEIAADGHGPLPSIEHLSQLGHKLQSEGQEVICDSLVLAVILRNLTKVIVDHKGYLKEVSEAMGISQNLLTQLIRNIRKEGLLTGIKSTTVEAPIIGIIKAENDDGKIHPDFGHWLLFLNIFEMHYIDEIANAKVGRELSLFPAGRASGHGHTRFGPNSGPIHLPVSSNPKAWVDMYQAWNAAFVAGGPHWPYAMAKLFNSEVGSYDTDPETYMHRRLVALLLYMHWLLADYGKTSLGKPMDWSNSSLTKAMGRANLDNMHHFESLGDRKSFSLLNLIAEIFETQPTPKNLLEDAIRG